MLHKMTPWIDCRDSTSPIIILRKQKPQQDKCTWDKGSATCHCITRSYRLNVWALCLVFKWVAVVKTNQIIIKKTTGAAHMCRTCCSVQTGEPCEINASSSISCCPRAKHNSPVMITHRVLQITLRNPKNQGLQAGANWRERGSGARGEHCCPDESGAEPVHI